MNTIQLTITNIHERGFAFGVNEETAEQCFIPPHVLDGNDVSRGDTVTAQVVPNPNERQRENTRWCAINLMKTEHTVKPEQSPEAKPKAPAELDEEVFECICAEPYVSSGDIALDLGVNVTTAGNSANRLFSAGRISKADVYSKAGQQRPSFILWTENVSNFMEVDQ